MGYFVTGIMSFLALIRKNSKYVFFAFFCLLWILFGLCINNADTVNYRNIYENINNTVILDRYFSNVANESGFRLFYKLFYNLGFSYQMFLIAFSFIGLFLIAKVVWKYSFNPNTVLVLYLLHPFTIDSIQLRSFMATAIVLYSIQFLVDVQKYGAQKFTIGVLLASTVHISALFYLVLLLIKVFNVKQCFFISFAGVLTIIFLYANIDVFIGLLGGIIPENKMRSWLGGDIRRTFRSICSTVGLRFIWIGLIYYFYAAYERKLKKRLVERDLITERLFKCNIIMLLSLGVEIFVKEYERLGRITFVIGYILFSRLFELRRTKALPWMFVFGFMGVYFIFFMFFSESGDDIFFERVFKNIFINNWLFQNER